MFGKPAENRSFFRNMGKLCGRRRPATAPRYADYRMAAEFARIPVA